jgi:FkbM family methyltransferase
MSLVLRLVRRLATLPVIRRLAREGPLLRFSFALRASLVRERARFAWNEVRPGSRTETYRLRDSGVSIAIRHKTPDVLVLDELISQHEYELPAEIEHCLPSAPRVADLGANIGLFGAWILGHFPDAEIVGIEPDPGNAAVHRLAIAANRNDRWRLVEAAASTAPGTLRLAAGTYATSHTARPGETAIEVNAVDAFPILEQTDLIKLDIEGGEWALIADPRFASLAASALVIEYHATDSPEPNARLLVERILRRAGFDIVEAGTESAYGTGVLWAMRRNAAQPRPA